MPCILHAAVEIPMKTGLPEDVAVNTFTFASSTLDVAGLATQASTALGEFYNGATGASSADVLTSYMGKSIDVSSPWVIKYYTISSTSDTVPDTYVKGTRSAPGTGYGSPSALGVIEVGAVDNGNLAFPNEVAVTFSFHADRTGASEHAGSGPRTAERRRGRVYVGPLSIHAGIASTVTGGTVVNDALITCLQHCGERLLALTDGPWSVWSRKDTLVRPVVGGFIDNAFDTQRRRGEKANARTVF
jgi:hypothetical protein